MTDLLWLVIALPLAGAVFLHFLGRYVKEPLSGWLASAAIGGAFFIVLQEKVSSYVDWYFMVIGAVLILIVLFMPRGLFGFRHVLSRRPGRAAA